MKRGLYCHAQLLLNLERLLHQYAGFHRTWYTRNAKRTNLVSSLLSIVRTKETASVNSYASYFMLLFIFFKYKT